MSTDIEGSIPRGSLLTDREEKKWITGSLIEIAGDTEIYSAAQQSDDTPTDYPVIVKIESRKNRFLSKDMGFYIANASPKDIECWLKANQLQSYMGIQGFLGFGTHKHNTKEYRFIVLEKCGTESWQSLLENGKSFSSTNVYRVACQTVRVLWYIHDRGLAHANITGENLRILDQRHVHLTNFSLASRYPTRDYQVEPRGSHIGSIKYSSREHHAGVLTMLGDFEMLLYSMIHWLHGVLPWNNLNDPLVVQKLKEDLFKNPTKFLQDCFQSSSVPVPIHNFMSLLASMDHLDKPNYRKILAIFLEAVQKLDAVSTDRRQYTEDNVVPKNQLTSNITADKQISKGLKLPKKTGSNVDPGLDEKDKDEMTSQDSSTVVNDHKLNHTNLDNSVLQRHLGSIKIQSPKNTSVKVRRSTRLMEKQVNPKYTEKCVENDEPRAKRKYRKRKVIPTDEENEQLGESIGDGNNATRECSPILSKSCGKRNFNKTKVTNPPGPTHQTLPATRLPSPPKSNRFQSPGSVASSSGISCDRSSQSGFCSEDLSHLGKSEEQLQDKWNGIYDWLNAWLVLKDKTLKTLGPIASEPQMIASQVQQVQVFRDEFRTQQPQIDYLAKVLSELPVDSDDTQKLDKIVQSWRTQLSRLEKHGQMLSDACFSQWDNVLEKLSDNLENHPLDDDTEEQMLPKLKNYAAQLESQQTQFVNIKDVVAQLCKVFSDSNLSSRVRAKFLLVNKQYQHLREKIDVRKAEIEKSLGSGDRFYDSCNETMAWLKKELGEMPENLLVSADRNILQQQLQDHEASCRRVASKETGVKELLSKGGKVLARLTNVEDKNLRKHYLELVRSQWDLLETRSQKILEKLKTSLECCKKYDDAQKLFLQWLTSTEARLESSKSSMLTCKDDIEKQIKELSLLNHEVLQKSSQYEQIVEFCHAYVGSCDKDKKYLIDELFLMRRQWKELNDQLLERKQLLENTDSFNKSLCDLKYELERCEKEWAAHDVLEKAAKDPKLVLYLIKELREKTACLQGPLNGVRQKRSDLLLKARKQELDISHLLGEMDRVDDCITNLKAKLAENYNDIIQILAQKAVDVKKEIQEPRQVGRNTMRQNFYRKYENRSEEVVDLVSDEDEA